MRPTFDISVQYFGIDWHHLTRVSCNLVQLTDEIIQVLRGAEDGANFSVDLVLTRWVTYVPTSAIEILEIP